MLLLDVDEKQQVTRTRGLTTQMWTDCRLQWDPEMFGGINRTTVPSDWLWMPNVVNFRSANDQYYLSKTRTSMVYYNGTVRKIPQDIYESPCKLDVSLFPFDRQRCTLAFTPWNLQSHELIFKTRPESVDLSIFLEHTEWDVVGSSSSILYIYNELDESNWTTIEFTLHLNRKPLYYIVNIIPSSVMQALLTLCVFFLPCDAGEKLSFSVSIFIATSIFIVMILDITPVTSESIPLILELLYFNTGIIAVSIAISIFILRVHHRSENDLAMNSTTRRIFLQILPPYLGLKQFSPAKENAVHPNVKDFGYNVKTVELPSIEDYGGSVKPGKSEKSNHERRVSMLSTVVQNVGEVRDILRDDLKNKELLQAWKYLSLVLDRLCFYVLLTVYICGVFAVFLQI
ncbi:neuronal acetylcholine receptor subunit beta-4-like isoform X2 [Ptychodera flava]